MRRRTQSSTLTKCVFMLVLLLQTYAGSKSARDDQRTANREAEQKRIEGEFEEKLNSPDKIIYERMQEYSKELLEKQWKDVKDNLESTEGRSVDELKSRNEDLEKRIAIASGK